MSTDDRTDPNPRPQRRLRRQGHPGPRGPRSGPQAARHVHRLDRSRRACTTSSGRSSTTRSTRRWPATARASASRCSPTAAAGSTTTVVASRSTRTRPARTRARARPRSCSPCCTPAASSAARATRSPAASTASASPSSTRCPSASIVEVDRDGKRYRQEYAKGGKPQGKMERRRRRRPSVAAPAAPRSRSGPIRRSSRPRAPSSSARTVLERLQTMAFLNKGLEIVFDDERPEKEQTVTYQYKGGLIDFVKHLNASKEPLFSKVCHFEDDDEDGQMLDIAIQWNTGYYEGIHGYANGISTIEGGMHVEGFRTALTTRRQQVRPGQEPAQGEGREPPRRGHPRGHHGDHLGQAARAAVRGPDQGQARQRPDALVRPEGHQRAARRVARGEPDRGQQGRQEGVRPRPRPAWPPRTPATRSAARRRCRVPACPTSSRTARAATPAESELFIVEGDSAGGTARRRPRPADAGDPADPRQDPQRRAGPRRQDAEEQRDPGADHGDRRRRRRGVRRRQGPLPQGHRAVRRRRRRQPHPHAAADVLLPPDARRWSRPATSTSPSRRCSRPRSARRRCTSRTTPPRPGSSPSARTTRRTSPA